MVNHKTLVVILANSVTEKMYNNYTNIFVHHYPVIFFSQTEPKYVQDNIIHIDILKLLDTNGNYQNLDNYADFSSIDAFFHEVNNFNYDYYWLINSNTYIHPDHGVNFLKSYDDEKVDFITFSEYYSKKYINKKVPILKDANYWIRYDKYFTSLNIRTSCNALCRISKLFTKHINTFRKNHSRFLPNNILFPSIANAHKLKQIVYTEPVKNILIKNSNDYTRDQSTDKTEKTRLIGFDRVNKFNKIKKLTDVAQNSGNIIIHPFPDWFNVFSF